MTATPGTTRADTALSVSVRAALAARELGGVFSRSAAALMVLLVAVCGLAALSAVLTADAAAAGHLVVLTVAAVAALTLWTFGDLGRTVGAEGTPVHPRRAIDVSAAVPQSDPDAPGHPRPRAPQSVTSAASR